MLGLVQGEYSIPSMWLVIAREFCADKLSMRTCTSSSGAVFGVKAVKEEEVFFFRQKISSCAHPLQLSVHSLAGRSYVHGHRNQYTVK